MLTKSMRKIFAGSNDLGNKIHSYYIYHSNKNIQLKAKKEFEDLLNSYSDKKFISLGPTKDSRDLIKKFIKLKNEPTWNKVVDKFIKGMIHLLEREITYSKEIPKPNNIINKIKRELKKIYIFNKEDIIKITEEYSSIKVDYISKKYSPEYDGKYESWRDTQLIFSLNFEKGLFIWDYINIYPSLRGKGMGTKLSLFCEELAKGFGFSRFTVEYPNRKYWIKKMNYEIPYKYRIGSGERSDYTLEGYKELR